MDAGGLLVVAHLNPKKRGSLEQQLAAVAAALGRRGIPTRLLFAAAPLGTVARDLQEAGATWGTLDFASPLAATGLRNELERMRPALVHLHFVPPHGCLSHAARASGRPVVRTEHLAPRLDVGPLRSRIKRTALVLLDRVGPAPVCRRIAVTAHVADAIERIEGRAAGHLEIIHHGVDLERFGTVDRAVARAELGLRGPVVACVARMAPEKGVDVALRALAFLDGRATLVVAGDGADREACARLTASLGLSDHVRFLGLVDAAPLFGACDQVWVPSRREAFGLAAAEAMAAGRPVVASNVGGLPEVVADDSTGFLVPPEDPRALAAAAASLFDGDRATRLGENGRARAARLFSMERFVDRTLALYDGIVPRWGLA